MGKKETKVGKKKIIHKKGFINKGLLFKGQVYPLFSDKQNAKSWNILNSIKSKNIKKLDYEALMAVITNARTTIDAEEGYIALNRARGIPMEVSVLALELANNRQAREFIIMSDEVLDFNQVSRNKVTINVLDGNQDTTPLIEEVSGQGLKRSKKKPIIEEPGDAPSKKKQEEIIAKATEGGLNGLIKYMVDGGYKISSDALNALYDDLIGQELKKAQRIAEIATDVKGKLEAVAPYAVSYLILKGIFPLYDPMVIQGASLLLGTAEKTIKPKTLETIENEVIEQKKLNEIAETKRIEYDKNFIKEITLGEKLGKGKSTGFIGAGNIDLETMNKIRAKNVKKYMDMKGYKSTGDLTQEDIDKLFPGKARERKLKEEKETANIRMTITETPPPPTTPPPPPPSPIEQPPKQTETAEEISEQIDSRLMEQEGTAGYSGQQGEEGLDLDDEEDVGIHNESIQRVSTMNDYDFTFTKKSLLQVNPLPNNPKMLKEMGERCIREYGHLLGILEPKDNYSKKEVEELYTLKHILKQVIRLEAQYKRALLKMRISVTSGGNSQLDKLMNNGQLGLVLNAGSLNISPQQAVEQSSTSPLKPQEQQQTQQPQQTQEQKPVDIFQELNEKKIKGKGKEKERRRMNLMYQRKRKAMLREPKNIVLRGRINDPPQYQNLRSEAERINQNPTPLVFKSNSRLNQMRRFNVNY